jgi:peptidoglycan/LPS O-acetylase OafA/YrhL
MLTLNHRNYLVDFLRGIAILLVMILHFHNAGNLFTKAVCFFVTDTYLQK